MSVQKVLKSKIFSRKGIVISAAVLGLLVLMGGVWYYLKRSGVGADPSRAEAPFIYLPFENNIDNVISGFPVIGTGSISFSEKERIDGSYSARFDGKNWVNMEQFPLEQLSGDTFTISGWVKSQSPAKGVILARADGKGFKIYKDADDKIHADITIGDHEYELVSNSTLGTRWHSFALVYGSGTIRLYFDGTENDFRRAGGSIAYSNSRLNIGSQNGNDNLVGNLDDIRIYYYALTSNEIFSLYARLIGKWFPVGDDDSYTLYKDRYRDVFARYDNPNLRISYSDSPFILSSGELSAAAYWVGFPDVQDGNNKERTGQFDGDKSIVAIEDNDVLTPASDTLSISARVRWGGSNGQMRYDSSTGKDFQTIVSKGVYSDGEYALLVSRAPDPVPDGQAITSDCQSNQINFYLMGNLAASWKTDTEAYHNTGIGVSRRIEDNLCLYPGTNEAPWHTISAVYDGRYASIYFDGKRKVKTAASVSFANTDKNLTIGSSRDPNGRVFYVWEGQIKRVTIQNTPLYEWSDGGAVSAGQACPVAAASNIPAYQAVVKLNAYDTVDALGQPINIYAQITNTGSETWTAGGNNPVQFRSHLYDSAGNMVAMDAQTTGATLSKDVKSGETASMSLEIPTGPGKSITAAGSYQLGFDAVRDGIAWFGNEVKVPVVVGSTRVQAQLDLFVKTAIAARQKQGKRLIDITASWCSDCPYRGRDLRNIASGDAAFSRWLDTLNLINNAAGDAAIDVDQMARDPWGSPFGLDENEREAGENYCVKDTIRSAGPDGVLYTGDDISRDISFFKSCP